VLDCSECKFLVPLLAYGDAGRLDRVTARTATTAMQAEDQMFTMGAIEAAAPAHVEVTVSNHGKRASSVLLELRSASREPLPGTEIEPSRFVLMPGASQQVSVRLQLHGDDGASVAEMAARSLRKLPGYRQHLLAVLTVSSMDHLACQLLRATDAAQSPWNLPFQGEDQVAATDCLPPGFRMPACCTAARLLPPVVRRQRLGLLLDETSATNGGVRINHGDAGNGRHYAEDDDDGQDEDHGDEDRRARVIRAKGPSSYSSRRQHSKPPHVVPQAQARTKASTRKAGATSSTAAADATTTTTTRATTTTAATTTATSRTTTKDKRNTTVSAAMTVATAVRTTAEARLAAHQQSQSEKSRARKLSPARSDATVVLNDQVLLEQKKQKKKQKTKKKNTAKR
jgi:hypothetical protein